MCYKKSKTYVGVFYVVIVIEQTKQNLIMKKTTLLFGVFAFLGLLNANGQEIQTIFKGPHSTGGYGAITNKFTYINGNYANMVGAYGGVYINHKFLLGLSGSAMTNYMQVPREVSTNPLLDLSYGYVQMGLMTEYVFFSNKTLHFVFNAEAGAGLTFQYQRYDWYHDNNYDYGYPVEDENWFFVVEPGVQLEINVLKWMRFSPGVSYRGAFGSDGRGLTDHGLSDISYNLTLKFGKF